VLSSNWSWPDLWAGVEVPGREWRGAGALVTVVAGEGGIAEALAADHASQTLCRGSARLAEVAAMRKAPLARPSWRASSPPRLRPRPSCRRRAHRVHHRARPGATAKGRMWIIVASIAQARAHLEPVERGLQAGVLRRLERFGDLGCATGIRARSRIEPDDGEC
jgi:hypothetical protein